MKSIFPPNFRRIFYVLPLFVTWLPGFLVESDQRELNAAKAGFATFFIFILLTLVLYIGKEVVLIFLPNAAFGINTGVVWIQMALSAVYVFGSITFVVLEYLERPTYPGFILQTMSFLNNRLL